MLTFSSQDEDDYSAASLGTSKLSSFTAPQAVLNDLAKNGSNVDPFADHKRPTIADRQNEYQQRMRNLLISPARTDPFADGKFIYCVYFLCHFRCAMAGVRNKAMYFVDLVKNSLQI